MGKILLKNNDMYIESVGDIDRREYNQVPKGFREVDVESPYFWYNNTKDLKITDTVVWCSEDGEYCMDAEPRPERLTKTYKPTYLFNFLDEFGYTFSKVLDIVEEWKEDMDLCMSLLLESSSKHPPVKYLSESQIDEIESKVENLGSYRDSRTKIGYVTDLITEWVIEELLLEGLNWNYDLSGVDNDREIISDGSSISSTVDYTVGPHKLELVHDYNGYWEKNGVCHLRQEKFPNINRNDWILGFDSRNQMYFAERKKDVEKVRKIKSHGPYGNKPAIEIRCPELHEIEIEFESRENEMSRKELVEKFSNSL